MNKMMLREILKFVITILLFHFVGYILVYNILIQGRSLSQIHWRSEMLLIALIISILGTVWRFKSNR